MKLKIYLRMLFAAVMALFVATACGDSDEDGKKGVGPEEKPLTFQIAVSNIVGAKATLAVTPSDQSVSYYWSAVKKSIYDGLGSDEAFLQDDLSFLQKEASKSQMTLEAYLQWKTGRGTNSYTLTKLEGHTEYYAYVYGIKTDGTVLSGLTKVLFTSGEGEDDPGPGPDPGKGPKFRIFSLSAGDQYGANKETTISVQISTETEIVAGRLYVNKTSVVNQMLDEGYSYESIIREFGEDLDRESVGIINDCVENADYVLGLTLSNLETDVWTVICMVSDDNGDTVTHGSIDLNGGGPIENGPNLTLSLTPGDKNGENTDTQMSVVFEVTGSPAATAGKYLLDMTASIDNAGGVSVGLLNQEGMAFSAEQIEFLNSGGLSGVFGADPNPLVPNTEYTLACMVTDADGNITLKTTVASTTGAGGSTEASEAYKAWLGTWTVTSESSEKTDSPISFDVTISQNVVNSSYKVAGWTVTRELAEVEVPAKLSADGSFVLPNQSKILTLDDGKIVYFISRYYDFGPAYLQYMLCEGNFNGLVATVDGTTGERIVTGGTINFDGDPADYFVSSMDYFVKNPTTNKWGGYSETGDYPVGPYTMTKKANAVPAVNRINSVAMAEQVQRKENARVRFGSASSILEGWVLNEAAANSSLDGQRFVPNYQLSGRAAVKVAPGTVSKVRAVRNN